MKRGQISIFVIIGILIIVVVGIWFGVRSGIFEKEKVNPEVQPIYSFVEDCLKKTGYEAIDYTSKKGGYFVSPNLSLDNGIPYYLYEGKNLMPSKEKFEEQISLYIEDSLIFCINGFIDFPDFEVEFQDLKTETKILDENVEIKLNYPLSILKGENSYTFKNFEVDIPVRLGIVYSSAFDIILNQMDIPDSVDIFLINEVGLINDVDINLLDYDDRVVILTIVDKNSKINEDDLIFNFANKYLVFEE